MLRRSHTVCHTSSARRDFLRAASGACVGAGALLLGSCSRTRYVDVLAPPSSVRPNILRLFERRTGIQVRPSSWISPTDALGKVMSSNAQTDLIVAIADLFAPVMPSAVQRGLVLPLDRSRLPRIEEFSEPFRRDVCLIGDGLYMVPIYWGYTSVLYIRTAISPSDPLIDSWGLLFDDRFRGRVALRDDPHESIAAAALYMGHKDPLNMDLADLNSVKGFLIAKKPNFRALWSNLAEAVQLIATREVDAIYGQPVIAQTLASQGVDVRANLTREGLLLFVQGALMPGRARHPDYANEWLKFLFSPEIAARLTQEAGVLSPVESIRHQLEGRPSGYGYEALSAGVPLIRLGSPQNLGAWIEAWAEFKAA